MDKSRFFPVTFLVLLVGAVLVTGSLGFGFNGEKSKIYQSVDEYEVAADTSIANQMSIAFERAANRISPSVVPIFAVEERIIESPFSDSFRDFFGDDMFRRFFGSQAPGQQYHQRVQSLGRG